MDPDSERPIGSGELIVSVVAAPICQQSPFYNFPASTTTFVGCGGYISTSVGSLASGKFPVAVFLVVCDPSMNEL